MNDKLVLTGVTGPKSGGYLLEYISANINSVNRLFPGGITVICRKTSMTEKIEQYLPNAKILRGELTDESFLSDAINGCDTLVHVAGIRWSKEIVDAAVNDHVRRVIVVHTTGIYSRYKAAGEEYRQIDNYVESKCKDNNILLTILRPTMIYGNIQDGNVVTFITMVDKLPIMPVVKGARFDLQPVHYKDLGKAYYDVLINEKTGNHNYTLSGGEVIQLREMLEVIGKNLGKKKVRFISFPFLLAYSGAWVVFLLSFGKIDYREPVQRLCEPRAYDHDAATRDFGYCPRTFRVGVVEEVKEYIENK